MHSGQPVWMGRALTSLDASTDELVALLGISRDTLRRWMTGATTPPDYAVALVRLYTGGDLGQLQGAWEGWRLTREGLTDPWGREFSPTEIGLLPDLWRAALTAPAAQADLFAPPTPAERLRAVLDASKVKAQAASASGSRKRRR